MPAGKEFTIDAGVTLEESADGSLLAGIKRLEKGLPASADEATGLALILFDTVKEAAEMFYVWMRFFKRLPEGVRRLLLMRFKLC